jgi:voltage-gated potassium channel
MQKYLLKKFGRGGYNLLLVLAMFVVCLVGGVLFYHNVEGLRPVDAVYFTTMTLTTVGYGDFSPQTDAGKLFTAAFALVGVALFFGLATSFFSLVVARLQHAVEQKDHKP